MGLMPLMVQENYLNVSGSYGNKYSGQQLQSMLCASQSIADGDLIDANVRKSQSYSALPYHAVLSALKPAKYSSQLGRLSSRIAFPQWLGKFSGRRKNDRCFSEVAMNMNSSHNTGNITGQIVTLEYIPMLKQMTVAPMKRNGKEGI